MLSFLRFLKTYYALIVVAAVFAWSAAMIVMYRTVETPPDSVSLRIGHWQLEASVRDALTLMAEEYRKTHPNVYIIQDAIPESVYAQWISTQLMGGTAPDMIQVGHGSVPGNIWLSYYNRYFLPLGRYVGRPNPYNKGNELENEPLRKTYKDGMRTSYIDELQEYISVPLSMFGVRIFYNQTLLKKLTGLDTAPAEYRAFLEVCAKIASQTNPYGKPYIPIASSGYHFGMWEDMMFNPMTYGVVRKADFNRDAFVGNDELFFAFKTGRVDFDFPPIRGKYKMIREVSDYFQTGYTGLTRDEAVFLFAQQKAVFMTTGTWDARSLEKQAEGQFEVGVMDFPLPLKSDPYYGPIVEGPVYERPGGGFSFAITRTCKHQDIALDFLLFIAGKEKNEELNRIIGWIPCILGTQMDPMLQAFAPHLEGVYGAFPQTLGGETITRWNQLFSSYQINQLSFEDLAKDYTEFYLKNGMTDFLEQQRDWRRGMLRNEQFLAGIRAKAVASTGDESTSAWVKYRALTTARQIWSELTHSRQMKLIEKGADAGAVGPYEYSPAVMEKITKRVKEKMRKER